MAPRIYHVNPESGRVGLCKTKPGGSCPFGSSSPHFGDREEARAHSEKQLEETYGLFPMAEASGELELTEAAVQRRLSILPRELLDELVYERHRLSHTPREAAELTAAEAPYYSYYGGNHEASLNYYSLENERAFMRGGCSLFAADLHRATGWPIVVYSEPGLSYWQGHVAVRTPSGSYLDYMGLTENPRSYFGAYGRAMEEKQMDLQELTALVDGSSRRIGDNLGMLERQTSAYLSLELLRAEGLLKD